MPRTYFTIVLCFAAAACEPDIPKQVPSSGINSAVFNLSTAEIPQPNEISLQPSVIASLPKNAQTELLQAFAVAGGFPNDLETPVTVQFQRLNVANGQEAIVAPQLDIASLTPSTIVAIEVPPAGVPTVIPLAPITAADYAVNGNTGTLTLHNKGQLPWPAGSQIIIAVRGNPGGITSNGGEPVYPSPNFFLLLQNQDLSLPQNTTLLPGDRAQQLQEGAQLEALRLQYQPAFQAISALAFPSTELAAMTTFSIAPAVAVVETSVASGVFPVPSDYLLNPAGTYVQNIPAFGPLAAGIATLDGFSTTALITATTSAPILAATVTGNTVFLYDLSNPSTPVLVPDATPTNGGYVSQPSQVVQMTMGVAVSDIVALQPAVPISGPNGPVALPPLKEATEYAVVITNGVKDLSQKPLSSSTLSSIVLLPSPLVDSAGNSQLSGVSNSQAASLERMRLLLQPVVAQVQNDKGVTRSQIAAAYTFRTQTITGKTAINNSSVPPGLLQLAALPYSNPQQSTMFVSSTPAVLTPVQAYARFGIDTTLVPDGDIAVILEATFPTLNLLSDTTGAFGSGPPVQETIRMIVAVPYAKAVPLCPSGGSFPTGSHCAPLVVFHHGLDGAAGEMLTVANELTKQGFVVAALDAPKHGDRSWCSSDAQCATGSRTCVPIPGAAAQGDAIPPGICSGELVKEPILCATAQCRSAWNATGTNKDGVAVASGDYLISGNLFRTRDTLRQDVIDASALILTLSRPPQLPAGPANPVVDFLAASGIVINPSEIYWEGQSLGAILGALNVPANPRITRNVLNVGGGTIVDILTNAPAFAGDVDALLASLGIQPGTPEYVQFILLAKWVLDPAEPVNVADSLLGDAGHPTLPNLLTMAASQSPKPTLAQLAACDDTVPNAFNIELDSLIGLGPVSTTASTLEVFVDTKAAGGACPFGVATISPGTVPHTFLTSWGVSVNAMGAASVNANVGKLTLIAQDQNAAFLANPTQLPPAEQTQP